jgi:glucose dehydrogenase
MPEATPNASASGSAMIAAVRPPKRSPRKWLKPSLLMDPYSGNRAARPAIAAEYLPATGPWQPGIGAAGGPLERLPAATGTIFVILQTSKNLMPPKSMLSAAVLFLATGVLHAQGNVTEERVIKEAAGGTNWFLKGGDFGGEHFSPLDTVHDGNVAKLGLAWSADLPVPDGIATTPIAIDGVIYLSGAYSVVFALDASTGKLLWSHDPGVRERQAADPNMSWPARANRGVAVWRGKVFVTTADCWLVALDAGTGK